MKAILTLCLALGLMFPAAPIRGAPPDVPTIGLITQGKVAPYDGFLVDVETWANMRAEKEQAAQRAKDALDLKLKLQRIDLTLTASQAANALAAEKQSSAAILQVKEDRIKELQERVVRAEAKSSGNSTAENLAWFGAGAGAVVLGAVCLGLVAKALSPGAIGVPQ